MAAGRRNTDGESLPLCGHAIGPYDVLVRVQGDPEDFLICQACWQPGRSYKGTSWRVDRLYGGLPGASTRATTPTPCLGCGRRVVRAKSPRLTYITCSASCTSKASRIRSGNPPSEITRPCQECGELFTAIARARYCSVGCRNRAYRQRKNAA